MNQTFTFANATIHTIQVLDTSFIGASGKRYTFQQWTYVGDGSTWDPTSTMTTPRMYGNFTTATCQGTLNCPFLAQYTVSPTLGCKTNCFLDALTTVPATDGPVMVKDIGGTSYALSPTAPHTFQWPNGTLQTLQVLSTNITASSGARYIFKQWTCGASCGVPPSSSATLTIPAIYYNYTDPARNPPLNGLGAFTAQFDKQYPLTLTFTDQQGNPVSPPASLQIVNTNFVPNTIITLTSYSGVWESAVAWSVRNAVWEGSTGVEVPLQSVDLTSGAATGTIKLMVYPATIKALDSSNNPVAGVSVAVSFSNSTTRTFQTNGQGLVNLGYVPLGKYQALVTYQGSTICTCVVDESQPNQNPLVVSIPTGSSPVSGPIVSSIVLLAIFGLATFLILLAIKVRKPPPPPTIE